MKASSLNDFCTSTKRLVKEIFISSFQNMFINRYNCYENFLGTNNTFPNNFNPLSAKFIEWPNTLKQLVSNLPTNCLNVSDHFSGLTRKGLSILIVKNLKRISIISLFY